MIKYGDMRGDINLNKELEVHYNDESFWIKVVAINRDASKVVGVLMNNLLNKKFTWGTMILAKEIHPEQLAEVQHKVTKVPNNEDWSIL